ncbi:MAG TPA: citrate/2-methylcitrate synthase, partial [Chloroflexota bacterium]|nr:citrate/2-methylcitrate synthase [Chloroflexota bacterium]
MSITRTTKPGGLEDVVAATSAVCDVNGKEGRLFYYGLDIHDLAAHSSFEETVFLLWHGHLPTRRELEETRTELAKSRTLPPDVLRMMAELPRTAVPMEVLRTAVSLLSMYDPDDADSSREANVRKATRLVAQTPTIVAAIEALRKGRAPLAPRPDLSLAANFLYMLFGEEQDPTAVRAMDVALILHADHELNASTFAARVTAATLADMYSAIVSAICALKGPLHGGANEQVFKMLQAIGSPERAATYVKDQLAAGKKIMGFGHRVYRTEDPRATHLRRLSRELGEKRGEPQWHEISWQVEQTVKAERGLYANVDFYSASTYHNLGIPTDLFTPVFAISRMSGWT